MFTKVVPICLAIVFLRDFGNTNVAGLAITCKSPPVYSGDRALVTCDFNVPVSTTRPAHFAVDFYPEGSTSPVEIAECTNLPDADLDCKAKRPGETFRMTEDPEKLVVEINETTTDHAGRYMCKLSTPDVDPPQLEPCRLTVSDRPRAPDGRRPSTRGYPSSSPSMDVTGSPGIYTDNTRHWESVVSNRYLVFITNHLTFILFTVTWIYTPNE
ncbi:hypothetical protein V1264_017270 [Littorina saxatilis]|uniref:Immunoglobulin subtype domain-containing protein n=1 Tax=Littorina saxatilis TaxID=31220 RepID=A0AAN9BIW5_9CAEN